MPLDPREIYYGVDGARQGPVEIEVLRARVAQGSVSPDDYVWDDDLEDWVPIRDYPALLGEGEVLPGDPGLTAVSNRVRRFDYATALFRFTAWVIDVIVLLVPLTLWEFAVEAIRGVKLEDLPPLDPTSPMDPQTLQFMLWFHGGALVVRGLYWVLLESSSLQATLGKKLLGMVVTDEIGHRLSPRQALVRYLGRLFCELTLGVGYLLLLFDERRQGLHDRLARTFVLRP